MRVIQLTVKILAAAILCLVLTGTTQPSSRNSTYASAYGVSAEATPSANHAGLQSAIADIANGKAPATLILPRGEIAIDGGITLPAFSSLGMRSRVQVIVRGEGAGENGSWLHFKSGSLRVRAANHLLENFRVTSSDGDALVIEASDDSGAPSRSALRNIRAEYSAGSGIVISGTWIHLFENVFARFNRDWGIEGRADAKFGIAANALTIVGGELQGNGRIRGGQQRAGGKTRGAGGGILTGPLVQLSLIGTAIEGNIGDGIFISEGTHNVNLRSVYFEKNGSHPDNRDITNLPPSRPGLGPRSVIVSGSNFTANVRNGEPQSRAIELWDVKGLLVQSPVIFGSNSAAYELEPIAIRETSAGEATGWIELPEFRWSGYTQDFVHNDTTRFGFPQKANFAANQQLGNAVFRVRIPLKPNVGRRLELISLFDGLGGTVVQTRFRRGPNGTTSAIKNDRLEKSSTRRAFRLDHQTHLPADAQDFVQIEINATEHGRSTRLIAIEVTTFDPVIGD